MLTQWKKKCLFFQIANSVLSDKLLGSCFCLKFFGFELSPSYKVYKIYWDRICWVSLQKIIIFSFHSVIFHSKIHNHPGTFFWEGLGQLKENIWGEGEGVYTYKMIRDEEGGGNGSKIRSFEWKYFLNDSKVFVSTKIYDMLIFNVIPILIPITHNGLP